MTGLDLDRLAALADAAAPGPWADGRDAGWWKVEVYQVIGADGEQVADTKSWVAYRPGTPRERARAEANAEFIAAARAAVPTLVTEVRRLRAALTDPAAVEAVAAALRSSPNGPWLTLPGPTDIAPGFAAAALRALAAFVDEEADRG